ncbi:low molecular weight phosphatase family protein [soil metagenome]
MALELPGALLFACNINQVRSPMAEALVKLHFGTQLYVDSCGLRPSRDLDPFVTEVIDEIGGDLSHHHPKSFDDVATGAFDLVISLTPEAQHRAVEMSRGCATEIEYWRTSDPTLVEGSREAMLDAYRRTRDELRQKILDRFGQSLTSGG